MLHGQRSARAARTLLLLPLLLPAAARAADYEWNGPDDDSFAPLHDASNWSPAGGPPGAGDAAIFAGQGGTNVMVSQSTTVAAVGVRGTHINLAVSNPAFTLTVGGTS